MRPDGKTALARFVLALCLLGAAVPLAAQSRKDIRIFIPEPVGGTDEQNKYFHDQFQQEVIGAGYSNADTKEDSKYTFQMQIHDNPDAANEGEEKYVLQIQLLETEGSAEFVEFTFNFTDLEAMNDWNLYILYKALANLPEEDNPDTGQKAPPSDEWRNKRLYLNFGAGIDLAYFLRPGTMFTDQGMVMPAAMAGVEWHLLDFLSLELDPLKIRFLHDGNDYILTPAFAALAKAVFKPGDYLMLEPYGGAEYALSLSGGEIPWLWLTAGIQIGLRFGARTPICLNISLDYSILGSMRLPEDISRNTVRFGIMAGFKIGFFDRKVKSGGAPAPGAATGSAATPDAGDAGAGGAADAAN